MKRTYCSFVKRFHLPASPLRHCCDCSLHGRPVEWVVRIHLRLGIYPARQPKVQVDNLRYLSYRRLRNLGVRALLARIVVCRCWIKSCWREVTIHCEPANLRKKFPQKNIIGSHRSNILFKSPGFQAVGPSGSRGHLVSTCMSLQLWQSGAQLARI